LKALIATGLVVIIAILATISYQLYRAGLSPIERECGGLFVSKIDQRACELNHQIHDLNEQLRSEVLNR
jgi:hypothetical protein